MIKHKVTHAVYADGTKFGDNVYAYRGVVFERDDSRKGYWGHYKTVFGSNRITTSTRAKLLSAVDTLLDKTV